MTFQELSDYNDLYMLQEADWSGWGKRAAATGAAAAALAGGSQFINTPPTTDQPAAIVQPAAQPAAVDPIQDPNFIAYIKNVENAALTGRQPNGMWKDHPSGEGGLPTFGYGHKIKKGEDFSQPKFSDADVEALLMKDLEEHEARVITQIGADVYNQLDTIRKQMLIDFVYNGIALKTYPKFLQAVINNDIKGMRAEYIRNYRPKGSSELVPLSRRNRLFYEYFLK